MSSQLDPRTALFVISGMQGAGKTTVGRQLAARFARAACVSADDLQRMIVSGGRWPAKRTPAAEATRQLRLRLHHLCVLGISFLEAGFSAVLDDIVIGSRVDDLLAELAGREFLFVMLVPRFEVVREREHERGTRLFEQWGWMDEEIRSRTRRIGLWIDSSELSVEQTVDEILARVWREGRVAA